MALDFSLLGQGPQFQNVLAAFQGGQQARKDTDTKAALSRYGTDPEGAISALSKVDPVLSMKLRDDMTARKTAADKRAVFQETDPTKRRDLAAGTGDPDVIQAVTGLDEARRKELEAKNSAAASTYYALLQMPKEQRVAAYQQVKPALAELGAPDFDPLDDAVLQLKVSQAQTVDKAIAHADAEAARSKPQVMSHGQQLVGPDGKVVYTNPDKPTYQQLGAGETLVEVGAPSAPSGGAAPDVDSVIQGLGGRVTSGLRTPERNAAVGGVPNSRHLTGNARDVVPPQGVSMAELEQQLKASGRFNKVINEGDHVHVQFDNAPEGGQPGARVIAQGAPKPQMRDLTAAEVAAKGLPAGTVAQMDPEGKINVVSKKSDRITDSQRQGAAFAYRAFQANDRMNDLVRQGISAPSAASLVTDGDGNARLVLKNQRDRQFYQAAKDWLAPILRKDTGAAVTDSELATYMDIYIPRFGDGPAVLKQKAQARHDAMNGLAKTSGAAYEDQFGDRKFNVSYPGDPKAPKVAAQSGGGRPSLSTIFGK